MLPGSDAWPVDRNIGIEPDAASEPWAPEVEYFANDPGPYLATADPVDITERTLRAEGTGSLQHPVARPG